MKKDLSKLSQEDKEKYLVYTRMNKVKIFMYIALALGAVAFGLGIWLKESAAWLMIAGAVFLTLFVALAIFYVYVKSIWEKILREARKKKKESK